jgi:hypothetical protein
MASKLRNVRESQKAHWVERLNRRKEALQAMGLDVDVIERDTVVRKLKAKVHDTTLRLAAIEANEKKLVDMARLREEKKAAPQKEKGGKAEAAEEPKAKKKKKKEEGGEKPVKKEAKKKEQAKAAAPEDETAEAV